MLDILLFSRLLLLVFVTVLALVFDRQVFSYVFSFFGEVFSLAFRFSFDDFAFAARFTTLLTVEHAFESVASSGRKGFYAMMTRVMKEAREKENGMKTVT